MAQTALDIRIDETVKRDVSLKEAIKEAQEQAVINGTSKMTLDEINDVIAECRREKRGNSETGSY